jgi:hypothetical protein
MRQSNKQKLLQHPVNGLLQNSYIEALHMANSSDEELANGWNRVNEQVKNTLRNKLR